MVGGERREGEMGRLYRYEVLSEGIKKGRLG